MNNVTNTAFGFSQDDQDTSFLPERMVSRPSYYFVKRLMDIIFSFFALIILAPVFLIIGIAIKVDSKGSIFYSQNRVGKNGKHFRMFKFRSMCKNADQELKNLSHLNEKDGPIFKISNDPRVTKVGRFIRMSSIDELPQLLNILRGDMTVVGPRPPLVNEAIQYTPYQAQRLIVKPGLTCYWQISGRSNLGFQEWIELDLKYIKEQGYLTDLKIIIKTIPAVLNGIGAY